MKKGKSIVFIIIGLILIISIAVFIIVLRGNKGEVPEVIEEEFVQNIVEEKPVENKVIENKVEEPEVKDEEDYGAEENNPVVGYLYGRKIVNANEYYNGASAIKAESSDKWIVLGKEGKPSGKKEFYNLASDEDNVVMNDKQEVEVDGSTVTTYCLVDKRGTQLTEYTIYEPVKFGKSDYAPANKGDKYVFVNKMGAFQKDEYEKIIANPDVDTFACKKDGKVTILDKDLKQTQEYYTDLELDSFFGKLICIKNIEGYGLMTTKGEILQVTHYTDIIHNVVSGYGVMGLNGESFLMDNNANEKLTIGDGFSFIPFEKYDKDVDKYVYITSGDKKGLINTADGTITIGCDYDDIKYLGHKLFAVSNGGNYGIRGSHGEDYMEVTEGVTSINRLNDEKIAICQNGVCSLYDFSLNNIPQDGLNYDEIGEFNDGFARVRKNINGTDYYGYIDGSFKLAIGNFSTEE